MIEELQFYKEYFGVSTDAATKLKIQKLHDVICDDKIYKFIMFDENEQLNKIKLETLRKDELWFSHYIYLNDSTEFEIKYDVKKVANKVRRTKEGIKKTIESLKEIYDVCSFTYRYDDSMWENYSNGGNGICLVFKVEDYDMLFPIDYIPKWKIDYNKIIIDAFKKIDSKQMWGTSEPLSLLPYVTKNPQNGRLDSTQEREVRILFSPFDDGIVNNGYIYPNVKKISNYRGSNVSYDYCKLKLDKIIIGDSCNQLVEKEIEDIAGIKNISLDKKIY